MRVPPPLPPAPSTEGEPVPVVKQTPSPLIMEFFPPGVFRRDQEFAARSVGMRYMAWWSGRYVVVAALVPTDRLTVSYFPLCRMFSGNSLPPVIGDANVRVTHLEDSIIPLSADVVVQAIQEEAAKFIRSTV